MGESQPIQSNFQFLKLFFYYCKLCVFLLKDDNVKCGQRFPFSNLEETRYAGKSRRIQSNFHMFETTPGKQRKANR